MVERRNVGEQTRKQLEELATRRDAIDKEIKILQKEKDEINATVRKINEVFRFNPISDVSEAIPVGNGMRWRVTVPNPDPVVSPSLLNVLYDHKEDPDEAREIFLRLVRITKMEFLLDVWKDLVEQGVVMASWIAEAIEEKAPSKPSILLEKDSDK